LLVLTGGLTEERPLGGGDLVQNAPIQKERQKKKNRDIPERLSRGVHTKRRAWGSTPEERKTPKRKNIFQYSTTMEEHTLGGRGGTIEK